MTTTGEIAVTIFNFSNEKVTILPNERIAQLVILPFLEAEFDFAEELPDTERGEGGFGSTGK